MAAAEAAAASAAAVDHNGFLVEAEESQGNEKPRSRAAEAKALRKLRRREQKWAAMMAAWPPEPAVLSRRLHKGVPDAWRGRVWAALLGCEDTAPGDGRNKQQGPVGGGVQPGQAAMRRFQELSRRQITEDDPVHRYMDVIERDLHRTFPQHEMFLERTGVGQTQMREVLRAYALHNPSLGYCQGMGMVAGMLLMHTMAPTAFCMLVRLLDQDQLMARMFDDGLREVQICALTMEHLLRAKMPDLGRHMQEQGMAGVMFMTDWFLCAFIKTLPWDTVLRLWDVFLLEGRIILFRTAFALLQLNRKKLLTECPTLQELFPVLRNLPRETCRPSVLLPAVLKSRLTVEDVDKAWNAAKEEFNRQNPPKPKASDKTEQPRKPRTASTSSATGNTTTGQTSAAQQVSTSQGGAKAAGQTPAVPLNPSATSEDVNKRAAELTAALPKSGAQLAVAAAGQTDHPEAEKPTVMPLITEENGERIVWV